MEVVIMANQRFKFKLFTSPDPDAQYAAVTTKDALTFYLLNNGKGHLGETKLFDATDSGSNITLVESIASNATGTTTEAPSTKALVDYVTAKISASGVLTDKFFRAVKSHTITDADLTNTAISVPDGTQTGDVGLLFTADNDNADGNEQYYFVSLKNYLSTVHTFGNTNSITFTTDANNNVTANLKIADGEDGLIVDATGLHLNKVDTINEDTPTDKIITENKMISYVQNSVLPAVDTAITKALKDVVTSEVDDGTGSAGSEESGGNSDISSNGETYSTEEIKIGTWIDGKPIYRKVFETTTPAVTPNGLSPFIDISSLNIKNVINLYGFVNVKDDAANINMYLPINSTSTDDINNNLVYVASYVNMHSHSIYFFSDFVNAPTVVILEYTKTID